MTADIATIFAAVCVGAILPTIFRVLYFYIRAMRPSGKVLEQGISPRFANAVTAVRGKLTLKANEYRKKLDRGEGAGLPFDRIVECNIGNPQALGQKPITFVRQVCALTDHPILLRNEHKLNLYALGFKDDAIERARTLMQKIPGGTGAYSESQGSLYVREKICEFIAKRDGQPAPDPSEIFLTDGASESVKLALQVCLRDEGDTILLPIPQYPLYSGSINLFGGSLEGYYLDEDGGTWSLSPAELRRAIGAARLKGKCPRALVVINPGNPTGNTLSVENMKEIVEVCAQEKLVLFADEVYQSNLYESAKPFVSFRKVVVDMGLTQEQFELFSFHSISKGFFGECGRRGGYVECYGITAEAKQAIYRMIALGLCANVAGQIVLEIMVNPPESGSGSFELFEEERIALLDSLKKRAQYFCSAFNTMDGVQCNPAEGALYLFPKINIPQRAIAKAAEEGVQPDAFYAEKLLDATGICIVPGSGFKQRPDTYHLRFAFLPSEEAIAGVIGKMKAFHMRFMDEWMDVVDPNATDEQKKYMV